MYADDAKHMEKQWGRRLAVYSDVGETVICSVWAEEALTGWVLYIPSPVIITFHEKQCLAVPFEAWLKLAQLGNETVTPFRVVAKGRDLVQQPFMPHVPLKHAIRAGADDAVTTVIPVEDFKVV